MEPKDKPSPPPSKAEGVDLTMQQVPMCREHSGEKLIAVCVAHNVPICIKCLTSAHNGHEVMELPEYVETNYKRV